MEVWVVVGLEGGLLESCLVFDNLYAAEQEFKEITGVSHQDFNTANDSNYVWRLEHPLMENWKDPSIDVVIVNTTIE